KEKARHFDMSRLSEAERRGAQRNLGSHLGGEGTQRILAWAMSRFPETYKKDYRNPNTGRQHRAGEFSRAKTMQNAYRLLRWIRTHGTMPTHIRETVAQSLESGDLNREITNLAFRLAEEFINGDRK